MKRLLLTEDKVNSLVEDMQKIAKNTNLIGKSLKVTRLADDLILQQVTEPLGVLMAIFESGPGSLSQICSLAISSGNALLLKSGPDALNTNKIFHKLAQDSLQKYVPKETITLLKSSNDLNDLLSLEASYIDLIIPRGSSSFVRQIKKESKYIPVLGLVEGVCHVYIDKEVNAKTALDIIRDSKCDYPSATNSLETLLIHKNLANTELFHSILEKLANENVKINSGPLFQQLVKFPPPLTNNFKHKFSTLEINIELVDDVQAAIDHINKYSSGYADSIVTDNQEIADNFFKNVDSACVFHNVSTRFADSSRFGLGAEVGISNSKIHERGPVGVEGLLTTKWLLRGQGQTAAEFTSGEKTFLHENLDPNYMIINATPDND